MGILGGIVFTGLLVLAFNPEKSVQLTLENSSAHDATLYYDFGERTNVRSGDVWKLESDDAGSHFLAITATQAPVRFQLSFTSATWNAKSFSLELEVIEEN